MKSLNLCSCRMRRRLCVAYHIERSIANRLGLPEYPCACSECRGARVQKVETIARHHMQNGRDPYLIYPVMVTSMNHSEFNYDCVFGHYSL